jgi:hypothetical protein
MAPHSRFDADEAGTETTFDPPLNPLPSCLAAATFYDSDVQGQWTSISR